MSEIKVKSAKVNIHGLQVEMKPVLTHSYRIWKKEGLDHMITSARDGMHSVGSYHYYGYAVDLRTWADPSGRQISDERKHRIAKALKRELSVYSDFYDIHIHDTHIHVEYDWVRAKLHG